MAGVPQKKKFLLLNLCEPEPEDERDTDIYRHSVGDIQGRQDNSPTGEYRYDEGYLLSPANDIF